MKRFLLVPFCLLLLVSCGGQKTTNTEEEIPADSAVAAADSVAPDSVDMLSNLPMPKAADELFDDFIFNFAANKNLQRERILFPLRKVGSINSI